MRTTTKEITLYHCGYCKDKFKDKDECMEHEFQHDETKRLLNRKVLASELAWGSDHGKEYRYDKQHKGRVVEVNLPDMRLLVEITDGERKWFYIEDVQEDK